MEECGFVSHTMVDGRLMRILTMSEEHELGPINGQPGSWWLEYKPTHPEGEVEYIPWVDIGTYRPCFRVEVVESNYTKEKWGDVQIRGSVSCRIYANKLLAYSFISGSFEYALARASTLKTELLEHPIGGFLMGQESLVGRRVWYKGQPGVITEFIDGGNVSIESDGIDYFDMKEPWMTEDHDLEWAEEWAELGTVIADVLSDKIWWFRDV